ncbi:hypothetical protein F5X68DRAFT_237818 [Plectosphaerella plurivora]|uniref:Uncharacterized protein n=1 Tax=Plectosphaerella plurivora TaxID=936078 RepID=A0A9P8V056_9PEZI|nr:hypothetical protein F5X68DRAFT_237818 [Plectosphaerella plurivora]
MSRKSAPAPIIIDKSRSTSYSSQRSARSLDSVASADSSTGIPHRNRNVYTHCGRHTNQFLFGGRSLTDMARSVFRRE